GRGVLQQRARARAARGGHLAVPRSAPHPGAGRADVPLGELRRPLRLHRSAHPPAALPEILRPPMAVLEQPLPLPEPDARPRVRRRRPRRGFRDRTRHVHPAPPAPGAAAAHGRGGPLQGHPAREAVHHRGRLHREEGGRLTPPPQAPRYPVPMPAAPDPRETALRRRKAIALLLLALAGAGLVAASVLERTHPHWAFGFLAAVCEAALV